MRVREPKPSFSPPDSICSARGAEIAGGSQTGSAVLPRLGYSVAEAAQVTSISKSKLWELIKSGELGSTKVAGRRIIRHSDLVALLNRGAI